MSYAPPSIEGVFGVGTTNALSAGGQQFVVTGRGFGPPLLATPTVRYSEYVASSCRVDSDSQITCATAPGVGVGHRVVVKDIGGQSSMEPRTYWMPPSSRGWPVSCTHRS